jgi:hypothetical protein
VPTPCSQFILIAIHQHKIGVDFAEINADQASNHSMGFRSTYEARLSSLVAT